MIKEMMIHFYKDNKFSRTAYEKFLIESGLESAPDFKTEYSAQEKKRQLLTYLSERDVNARTL